MNLGCCIYASRFFSKFPSSESIVLLFLVSSTPSNIPSNISSKIDFFIPSNIPSNILSNVDFYRPSKISLNIPSIRLSLEYSVASPPDEWFTAHSNATIEEGALKLKYDIGANETKE